MKQAILTFFRKSWVWLALLYLLFALICLIIEAVEHKAQQLRDIHLKEEAVRIQSQVSSLIEDKRKATLAFTLVLSQNQDIQRLLANAPDTTLFKTVQNRLKQLSADMREYTHYKNVWLHLVDDKGVSRVRSWTDKSGDSLINARLDIARMVENPQIQETISTGKFTMSFKSMVPVYSDSEFVGMVEVITHFNSIDRALRRQHLNSLVLVDKRYQRQLVNALSDRFVNGYYIANIDFDESHVRAVQTLGLENLLQLKTHELTDQWLIVRYAIPDIDNEPMGHYLVFKPVTSIEYASVESFNQGVLVFSLFLVLVLVVIGGLIYIRSRQTKIEQDLLEQYAQIDSLTQIWNRRHGIELMEREIKRSKRYKTPLALILFDIDHFKRVNDTLGHNQGDQALLMVTRETSALLRDSDIMFRYGGEEFVVVSPQTNEQEACQLAERLRRSVEKNVMFAGLKLTISLGVVNIDPQRSVEENFDLVDQAMYQAKKSGRNRSQFKSWQQDNVA